MTLFCPVHPTRTVNIMRNSIIFIFNVSVILSTLGVIFNMRKIRLSMLSSVHFHTCKMILVLPKCSYDISTSEILCWQYFVDIKSEAWLNLFWEHINGKLFAV